MASSLILHIVAVTKRLGVRLRLRGQLHPSNVKPPGDRPIVRRSGSAPDLGDVKYLAGLKPANSYTEGGGFGGSEWLI